jgi:hypothetical protein
METSLHKLLFADMVSVLISSMYLLNRSAYSSLPSKFEAFSSAAGRNDVLYKRQMQNLPGFK